nr:NADH dehydrogenase [ubiquinone] 1 beta subcomplex subunit 7-like [Helicoverpa armigera]
MGNFIGTLRTRHLGLQADQLPTFNPNAGFANKRAQRAVVATPEAMSSAKIPVNKRDYCIDPLLEYQVCRYKNMPLLFLCSHERHAYLTCEQEDYVIRMKEFERERRLRERELRVKKDDEPPPPPSPKECVEEEEEEE